MHTQTRPAMPCGIVTSAVALRESRRQPIAYGLKARATLFCLLLCWPQWLCSAEQPSSSEPTEPEYTDLDRDHWSLKPLKPVAPPHVQNADWCRTTLDRFILAELESRDLVPLPETNRSTLLRRVTYDLTGLPPTPSEIEAFLADTQPGAYERAVDRLLGSPAYGARWAQHWLDLARFAETDGFEHDKVRPQAWRYRDWVIDALNGDLPYDQFASQQIAGDLLAPDDPAAKVATGFLLCGPDMPDINLQQERRHEFLNGMTSTTGAVFLGLQFGCAACHDHKFDPLSQFDFYRLRAFFEQLDLFRDHPIADAEERARIEAFTEQRAGRYRALEQQLLSLADANDPESAARREVLREELKDLKAARTPELTMGRVVRQKKMMQPAKLWIRGDFRRPGPTLHPDVPQVLQTSVVSVDSAADEPLDRIDLTSWLTSADNPLFARVIVNRIWQHHFGKGLSETPSDFGIMGDWPSHPELLDWLASELPRHDWSLKWLHREIVTSATYRTRSRPRSEDRQSWDTLVSIDPDNRWLGRMPRRRLEGEAIRDAMLAVAGRLNHQQAGPGIRPPLPQEVVSKLLKNQWIVTEDESQHTRRSIYLFVRRNLGFPLFEAFDRPNTNLSCPTRPVTTVAPQALTLLNSEFSLQCATAMARDVERVAGRDTHSLIREVIGRAYGRHPTPREKSTLSAFLEADPEHGLTDLCLAILNTNEFLFVD